MGQRSLKIGSLYALCCGLLIGACDLVPGISGGTMALILGIYEPLMNSISELKKCSFRNARVLFWVLGGVIASILSLSSFFHALLQSESKIYLYSLFFGLVIGSAWFIGKEIPKWGKRSVCLLIIGAVGAFGVTHVPILMDKPEGWLFYLWLICSGAFAVFAMLLPGISGSYVMMILGPYPLVIESLSNLSRKFDLAALKVLLPVAFGIVCGAALFSKLISYALREHKSTTLTLLLGFMIGATSTIFPFKETHELGWTTFASVGMVIFGALSVLGLESKLSKSYKINS